MNNEKFVLVKWPPERRGLLYGIVPIKCCCPKPYYKGGTGLQYVFYKEIKADEMCSVEFLGEYYSKTYISHIGI